MSNREYVNELNWSRVGSKSITGIAGSGEIVPHDSHRAIAQLGSRATVEADRDLDGGGPGPGSSDNLTLDLVSAAAVNAPSLINKMTRGRYWPHCLLMAHRCFRGVATFWSLTEQQRTMVGTGVECIGRE